MTPESPSPRSPSRTSCCPAASSPGRAYLDWTAHALGRDIDGVTVLTAGPAGTFGAIAIHHRPFGAVLAFSREMGRRLDGLIEPGHFAAE
jgi:hypothetical protein